MQSVSDLYHSSPIPAPSHPWEPRAHLHVDYAAHFMDKMPLIVVDMYSKWMEVEVATSAVTIETFTSYVCHIWTSRSAGL